MGEVLCCMQATYKNDGPVLSGEPLQHGHNKTCLESGLHIFTAPMANPIHANWCSWCTHLVHTAHQFSWFLHEIMYYWLFPGLKEVFGDTKLGFPSGTPYPAFQSMKFTGKPYMLGLKQDFITSCSHLVLPFLALLTWVSWLIVKIGCKHDSCALTQPDPPIKKDINTFH